MRLIFFAIFIMTCGLVAYSEFQECGRRAPVEEYRLGAQGEPIYPAADPGRQTPVQVKTVDTATGVTPRPCGGH